MMCEILRPPVLHDKCIALESHAMIWVLVDFDTLKLLHGPFFFPGTVHYVAIED